MNYTFRQLEVYAAVGKELSFTKAAEILHLTQPAVSIQFKAFAEQFDFPLIEYSGKQLILTELGLEVLDRVKEVLNYASNLSQLNKSVRGELFGTLTISVVSTGKYVIPYFLNEFLHAHPDVDLVVDVTNKSKVVRSLDQNTVDFALVSVLPEKPVLEFMELIDNKLYLTGNPTMAERAIKDLNSAVYLFREQGSATRQAMEKFLAEQQINPEKKVELTSNEAVKQSVIAGLGISIMPLIGMRNELNKGDLKIIDHPELPVTTKWNLVWRKDKKLSPVAAAYISFIQENSERMTNAFNM